MVKRSAEIYLGRYEMERPKLAALNSGVRFGQDIVVVHRSDGSERPGFTNYLSKVSGEWKKIGMIVKWRRSGGKQ